MAHRTASQTIGPFFHEALRWNDGARVTGGTGQRFVLSGRIIDGSGAPVGDAMVETWQMPDATTQPAADGKAHGMARVETARDGTFRIETTRPQGETPFLEVFIFARGLLKALHTRVYIASVDAVRNDPTLAPIAGSPRLSTLVARETGPNAYEWDVRLQGEGETIFFEAA